MVSDLKINILNAENKTFNNGGEKKYFALISLESTLISPEQTIAIERIQCESKNRSYPSVEKMKEALGKYIKINY